MLLSQLAPLVPLLVLAWHSLAHERFLFEMCVLCACALDGCQSVPLLVLATAVPCTYVMHGWGVRPWVRTAVVLATFVYVALAAVYADAPTFVALALVCVLGHLCGYAVLMEPWIMHRRTETHWELLLLVVAAFAMLAVMVVAGLLALLGVEQQAWAACEMLALALALHLAPHEPFLWAAQVDARYLPVQLELVRVADSSSSDSEVIN